MIKKTMEENHSLTSEMIMKLVLEYTQFFFFFLDISVLNAYVQHSTHNNNKNARIWNQISMIGDRNYF